MTSREKTKRQTEAYPPTHMPTLTTTPSVSLWTVGGWQAGMAPVSCSQPQGSYMKGKKVFVKAENRLWPCFIQRGGRGGGRQNRMSVCHFEVCLINRARGGCSWGNNKTLFTFQKCQVLLFVREINKFLKKKLKKRWGRGVGGTGDDGIWEKTNFGETLTIAFCCWLKHENEKCQEEIEKSWLREACVKRS